MCLGFITDRYKGQRSELGHPGLLSIRAQEKDYIPTKNVETPEAPKGASQAQNAGSACTKQDNCFTTIANAAELAQVADTLSQNETAGRLRQLRERWICTTCLCVGMRDLESPGREELIQVIRDHQRL